MRCEKTIHGRAVGAAARSLVAWSSLEDYELHDYLSALGQAFPGLTLSLSRCPTGELAARLRARDFGERPPDLVFGTAATVLEEPEIAALLAPLSLSATPAAQPPRRWVAASGFRIAFGIDVRELQRRRLPIPERWADLSRPVYRGLIALPDPAISGAGTLALAGMVQKLGPEEAWPLVAALRRNASALFSSSWSCARAALDAATPIAVSVEIACLRLADEEPAIRVVVPGDAAAVEFEGFSMLAGASDPESCREILAWTLGDAARAIARRWRKVTLGGGGALDASFDGSFVLDHERAARERASLIARFASLPGGSSAAGAGR